MSRRIQVACTSWVLFFLVAGCDQISSMSSYLAVESEPNGRERVVAGSVEQVAITTANALGGLGCTTTTTTAAEEIRVNAKTAHGDKFTVVLKGIQDQNGAQTRVRIEWESAPNDQFGFQVLGRLESGSGK